MQSKPSAAACRPKRLYLDSTPSSGHPTYPNSLPHPIPPPGIGPYLGPSLVLLGQCSCLRLPCATSIGTNVLYGMVVTQQGRHKQLVSALGHPWIVPLIVFVCHCKDAFAKSLFLFFFKGNPQNLLVIKLLFELIF